MIHKNKTAFWPSLISKGTLSSILTVNFLLANDMAAYQFEPIKAGSILESKDMHAIFQKKGKKGQNILKFGQKCTKFWNPLRKSKWLCVIIACNKLLV